ncbi:Lysophospholipid acyltransferase family protein [Candidatus Hepatincolaceae symbiont of Richtersius coronifer]
MIKKFYTNLKTRFAAASFIVLIQVLSIVAYLYLRFVMLTSKINYIIKVQDITNLKSDTYILPFWHGRLLSAFFIRKFFSRSYVLISYSKSAYLVQLIAQYFKTKVIKGSSNKGGKESIKQILGILKQKKAVFAIAPDGSIGPRMRCTSGIATIALLAQIPILPISFSAKKGIILNTWDRFFIPLPFNHITVYLDEPIYCRDTKQNKKHHEDIRANLENVLNHLTWKLDRLYKRNLILSADRDKKGRLFKIKSKSI